VVVDRLPGLALADPVITITIDGGVYGVAAGNVFLLDKTMKKDKTSLIRLG
jgi:hypothetical protein